MNDGVAVSSSTIKYFTEMCSGSEAGSYLRLIDFVYHATLGVRVIKKKKKVNSSTRDLWCVAQGWDFRV